MVEVAAVRAETEEIACDAACYRAACVLSISVIWSLPASTVSADCRTVAQDSALIGRYEGSAVELMTSLQSNRHLK